MKDAFFLCSSCLKYDKKVLVERGRVEEPTNCNRCNSKHAFELIHN